MAVLSVVSLSIVISLEAVVALIFIFLRFQARKQAKTLDLSDGLLAVTWVEKFST